MPMPRISSKTPLRSSIIPQSLSQSPVMDSSSPWPATFFAEKTWRHLRRRAPLFAILCLALLSILVILIQRPVLVSTFIITHPQPDSSQQQLAEALEILRNSYQAGNSSNLRSASSSSQIQLTGEEELAAITSFLTSTPANLIPSSVNPHLPIDPQLVLDFDTRGPHAMNHLAETMDHIWREYPVMLWSKFYSPASREIKRSLAAFHLDPIPMFIDVDLRDDYEVLPSILQRVTGSKELPILLVGGESMGTLQEIREKILSGELQERIRAAGSIISGAKAREKKH